MWAPRICGIPSLICSGYKSCLLLEKTFAYDALVLIDAFHFCPTVHGLFCCYNVHFYHDKSTERVLKRWVKGKKIVKWEENVALMSPSMRLTKIMSRICRFYERCGWGNFGCHISAAFVSSYLWEWLKSLLVFPPFLPLSGSVVLRTRIPLPIVSSIRRRSVGRVIGSTYLAL